MNITETLFSMKDESYRQFHARLMPTVDIENIIGVRVPQLRKYAKQLLIDNEWESFILKLPHRYYEQNNLHGILISQIKDFDRAVIEVERFLPHVDNWATCDMLSPVAFKKHPKELMAKIRQWIESSHTYTVRFGIEMLQSHFLDKNFNSEVLELAAGVDSDEYYVKMMVAWFFATALAKQGQAALPYIEQRRLAAWTHNKTIQKAIESYRIAPELKDYLRTLKVAKDEL